ncbi:phosphoadenosine phosphosulfate reductase family protein [Maridesulfovibrio ferrireducens]|uniref:phosphoadenosine phosphosulfate reductase family protein n=1 Tax=Maridesulfovibrio ferrireducens TaxID=246191 RepID=UPI001A29DCB1|nr:phosphoadenosine phosphosulfate reductase family protein [Maridesulfovibrio ferrireducens]MBI9109781.1 phosphoadenosine phosphosulfate reductase family protein [Maridesulfovibrio ferrireducens]
MITANSPLDEKVADTASKMKTVLLEHDPSKIAVAWTGGKDSTVVLAIWREVLKAEGLFNPLSFSIDTGVKFPEVMAFRDRLAQEWDIDLKVLRPEVNIKTYPVAKDTVSCCRDLKIKPLQKALAEYDIQVLITGIRRDEHPSRSTREAFEKRENPDHILLNPILEWTEMDIWSFITMHAIPYCELYDQGYRSLGCQPCTVLGDGGSERQGRSEDKEKNLELLTSLGYF